MKRVIAAFVFLGLVFAGGVEINHAAIVGNCRGANELRHETRHFVDELAAPTPYPPGVIAPQRASIDRSNGAKRSIRTQAAGAFRIRSCT
jgi:hypothetical protein